MTVNCVSLILNAELSSEITGADIPWQYTFFIHVLTSIGELSEEAQHLQILNNINCQI